MVREIKGPWGIILIGPAASNTPYKAWDRNQATYLAIAAAAPLFLTLFATISIPIVPGAYTAKMTVGDKVGEAMFGLWGTCLKGQGINDTIVDNCTPWSMMGGNATLLSVPANSWQIRLPSPPEDIIDHAIPNDLKWANLVFHAVAVTCAWLASTIALAASGEWHKQRQPAWDFLRWAWGMELISGMFSVIPWAMEIAILMRIKGMEGYWSEHSKQTVKVTAGPTLFLLSAALAVHIALALVRLFWSKNEPRPTWTLEAAGDFHSAPPAGTGLHGDRRGSGLAPLAVPSYGAGMGGGGMGMPNSAGLPANDEKPPAWENLNLDSSIQVTDEKYWPPTELDDAVPVTPAQVAVPQVQVQGPQAPAGTRV